VIIKPDSQLSADMSMNYEPVADLDDRLDIRAATRIVSGLYRAGDDDDDDDDDLRLLGAGDVDQARPVALAAAAKREELHLDVDGSYPQRVASGVVVLGLQRLHWIASLAPAGSNRWTGTIFYKDGPVTNFPYTTVRIRVFPDSDPSDTTARLEFRAPGGLKRIRRFHFRSRFFHEVDFEFDSAAGEATTTQVASCAHPNRPPALPCEQLTIKKVFQRAGFDVTQSPGGTVPIVGAGADARWSDAEMHDAMQVFWSRFSATAQWAMWVFFASLHEQGNSLGGIMFDDIGPNHRQGTAIFNDAFISVPPAGDPNPVAWVQRMIFWTACHEMGHAFNLAHSWQKSLTLGTRGPWVPGLADEPEARSFMNYPFRVNGGQAAFFANFGYRFSDGELLFMRHAPERFVQMGNADWFDHHGFEEARMSPQPALQLDVGVNRESGVFEFLEPVTLELKLTNVSTEPQIVDANILSSLDAMTVIIKPQGKPAREFRPFGRYCYLPQKIVLRPAESIYSALGVSAGLNGWDLAEPGWYVVQVALRSAEEDLVSAPLYLRVTPPLGYEDELIAQELFTEDVGRVLAMRGSEELSHANDVLREVVTRLSDRKVAIHAALTLGLSAAKNFKILTPAPSEPAGLKITARPPRKDEARELLEEILVARGEDAAETLGNISYLREASAVAEWLAEAGDPKAAAAVQAAAYETLDGPAREGEALEGEALEGALVEVARKRDIYRAMSKPTKARSTTEIKSSR
jgi:hypothetical protein